MKVSGFDQRGISESKIGFFNFVPKYICCAPWAGFINSTFRKSVVTCSVHLKLPLQDPIWPDVKVGIFQGEAELSQGLSVFILCSGIRPCASQIYPYVTKKRRVLSRPVPSAAASAAPPLLQESPTLLGACLPLWSNLPGFDWSPGVSLSSAQIPLQWSDVSGLACRATVSPPLPRPPPYSLCQITSQQAGRAGGGTARLYWDLFSCPINSFKRKILKQPVKVASAGSVTSARALPPQDHRDVKREIKCSADTPWILLTFTVTALRPCRVSTSSSLSDDSCISLIARLSESKVTHVTRCHYLCSICARYILFNVSCGLGHFTCIGLCVYWRQMRSLNVNTHTHSCKNIIWTGSCGKVGAT